MEKNEGLSKIIGGKVGNGEKVFFLFLSLATKH